MEYKKYLEICKDFADATKDWKNCSEKDYAAIENSYEETEINSEFLSVKWSFHKTPEEINELAIQMFINELLRVIDKKLTLASTEILNGYRQEILQ